MARLAIRVPLVSRLVSAALALALVAVSLAPAHAQAPQEIPIGAVLDLSGSGASGDVQTRVALEYAAEQINQRQMASGDPYRLRLLIEDAAGVPERTLAAVQGMAGEGVRVVIVGTSAEIEAVKDFATEQRMLVLSHSSSAPGLAVADNTVYRLVPDDTKQGRATGTLMLDHGVQTVLALYRDDVYGRLLLAATRDELEAFSGGVAASAGYSPGAVDFAAEVAWLDEQVRRAIDSHGAAAVAAYLISFDEGADILREAARYPALGAVRWFGSDGLALSPALTAHADAARFAAEVCLVNPLFGGRILLEPGYRQVQLDVARRAGAEWVSAYAINAYDALWLGWAAARAAVDAPELLVPAFENAARGYRGATGTLILNEAGDREIGDYDFWTIGTEGSEVFWQHSGTWYDLGYDIPVVRLGNCLASANGGVR